MSSRASENIRDLHQNQQLQRTPICTVYFSALSTTPQWPRATSPCFTHYPQTNQKVTKATGLALNCHTGYYPAFFFWVNMTFTILLTLSYHFLHIWEIYKENWLPESVICDKYHRTGNQLWVPVCKAAVQSLFPCTVPKKGTSCLHGKF